MEPVKMARDAEEGVVTPLERAPTPFDDKIYAAEWRAWRDPQVPDWIDPVGVLLDRHAGSAIESKAAIITDGKSVSYRELSGLARKYAGALSSIGVTPESRLLLFGTDSLDYVATWLGSSNRSSRSKSSRTSGGIAASTSSRTTGPYGRRLVSSSIACSRLAALRSSRSMSPLRVTRNAYASSARRPG